MPGRDRRELRIAMWGWSDDSETAAAMHARSRVDAVAARGGPRTGRERWDEYYPASPVREPVLVAYDGDGVEVSTELEPDSVRAFVTRTRYGAIVLNTDAVVIVDVDLPPPAPRGVVATIARWLSAAPSAPAEPTVDETSVLGRAHALAAHRPGVGVRTYRTRAGFRLLVTGTGLAPTDPGTAALLAELGSDPLYARLCSVQGSFRARLTPKPWRIAVPAADGRMAAARRRGRTRSRSMDRSVRAGERRMGRVRARRCDGAAADGGRGRRRRPPRCLDAPGVGAAARLSPSLA